MTSETSFRYACYTRITRNT